MSTNQPDKTPGQIAYNAYCQSVDWRSIKGDPLPAFAGQSKKIRDAWEAAAEAAISTTQKQLLELATILQEAADGIRESMSKS